MYRERGLSTGKLIALLVVIGVVFSVIVLKGMEVAKRRKIEERIEALSHTREDLLQTLASQRQHADELTQEWNNQKAELDEYKAKVDGYMLQHKMAVAAILAGAAGAGVAIDKDNVFTQDAKNAGTWMVGVAMVYTAFNSDEVTYVIVNLNQANATVHTKETVMAGTESSIQRQKTTVEATQDRLEQITHQVAELQKELDR